MLHTNAYLHIHKQLVQVTCIGDEEECVRIGINQMFDVQYCQFLFQVVSCSRLCAFE